MSPSRRLVRSVRTVALAAGAAVLAVPTVPAGAAPAAPPGRPVSALLTQLQSLYRKAEEAGEAYAATREKLKKQRAVVDRLGEELAGARVALNAGRVDAGRLARAQYRDGGGAAAAPWLRFLFSSDARQAMDTRHQIDRAADSRAAVIGRLSQDARRTATLASRSRDALNVQQTLTAEQRKQKDAVRKRLGAVEKLLASLSPGQLAELRRVEGGSGGGAAAGRLRLRLPGARPAHRR
ncbi:hypothetical protein BLA24_24545 [Streptomyces cinnamoneus]|uniref:NlpC/P60 family protein n=1 Tax=Streptomyces cinnamoneus TaxID=53446 RepID=A0A2G1XDC8_STRCJ|nr:hypothetical protein [Streptomyces cinnamoneus]PHQ49236.1 hypothetical protein BLA24_24545 [Streptomyces cinnamoneus]PPT15112.1 hypothetical protein CYQ11_21525 [Streptomyces cinnamoneus]